MNNKENKTPDLQTPDNYVNLQLLADMSTKVTAGPVPKKDKQLDAVLKLKEVSARMNNVSK